jgi:hypothetical protein
VRRQFVDLLPRRAIGRPGIDDGRVSYGNRCAGVLQGGVRVGWPDPDDPGAWARRKARRKIVDDSAPLRLGPTRHRDEARGGWLEHVGRAPQQPACGVRETPALAGVGLAKR